MFIACGAFFTPKLCRSAIASASPGEGSDAGFAPERSEIFGCALGAINISLLRSENEFNCCSCKLTFY